VNQLGSPAFFDLIQIWLDFIRRKILNLLTFLKILNGNTCQSVATWTGDPGALA
jgi:hypothetical protein